jgi:hypothetical protein
MKTNWLLIIGWLLFISSVIAMIQIYYNEKYAECISNPLVYSAKYYEEKYGYAFQGSESFLIDNPRIQSPILYFNSYNVTQVVPIINRTSGITINWSDLFSDKLG